MLNNEEKTPITPQTHDLSLSLIFEGNICPGERAARVHIRGSKQIVIITIITHFFFLDKIKKINLIFLTKKKYVKINYSHTKVSFNKNCAMRNINAT